MSALADLLRMKGRERRPLRGSRGGANAALFTQLLRGSVVVGFGTLAWRLGNFLSLFLIARAVGDHMADQVGDHVGDAAAIPLIATAMAYGTIANLAVGTYLGRAMLRQRHRIRTGRHASSIVAFAVMGTLASSAILAELCRRTIALPIDGAPAAWGLCFLYVLGFAAADGAVTTLNVVGDYRGAAAIQLAFGVLSLAICGGARLLPGGDVIWLYAVVPASLLVLSAWRIMTATRTGSRAPPPTANSLLRVARSVLAFSFPLLVSNACINPLVVYTLSSLDAPAATRASYLIAYTWMGACAAIPGFLNTSSQKVIFARRADARAAVFVRMLVLNVGIAAAAVLAVTVTSGLVMRQYGSLGHAMGGVFVYFLLAAIPFAAFQAVATQILAFGRSSLILGANLAFAAALVLALRTQASSWLGAASVGPSFLAAHLVRTGALVLMAWRAGLLVSGRAPADAPSRPAPARGPAIAQAGPAEAAARAAIATAPREPPASGARLGPRLHASLDAARAAAACYVVLHHVAEARGWTHGAGVALRFGQEAVLVFFLLSGFVIFANERTRALRPAPYYLRRLRRIYPPLLAAMAVSTLVAFDNGDLRTTFSWGGMIGTLLSLQDVSILKPGVIVDPYLDNAPLWSLSYEVAFYALFPVVLMAWRRRPVPVEHAVGALCCLCYGAYVLMPNHWCLVGAYFLVWWCGAMAAAAYVEGGRTVRAMAPTFGWLIALCALSAAAVVWAGDRGPGLYPVLMLRHFVVAAVLLATLFGPLGARVGTMLAAAAAPAAALASISYGLYVLHYPLLVLWHRAQTGPGLVMAVPALLLAAWLADVRLGRLLPRAPAV